MTGLDWIIVVFTVLMALWGYAQGLIVGALSLAGFALCFAAADGALGQLGEVVFDVADRSIDGARQRVEPQPQRRQRRLQFMTGNANEFIFLLLLKILFIIQLCETLPILIFHVTPSRGYGTNFIW